MMKRLPENIARRLPPAADRAVRESVPPVSLGLGVLYALFALAHEAALPESFRSPMVILAAATSVVMLAIHTAARRRGLPNGGGQPTMAGILALVLANSITHLQLGNEIIQVTNLMLIAVAAGGVLLSRGWFWAVLTLTTVTGLWAAADAEPVQWRPHFLIGFATTVAIGAVFRRIRFQSMLRYETALAGLEAETAGRRQAGLAAESASRTRTEFVTGMGRELRAPLDTLISLVDRLQELSLPPAGQSLAGQVREEADKLREAVGDLLEIASNDAGLSGPQLSDADLRQLLRGMGERYGQRAREKGVEFHVSVDPGVPGAARVDVRRLRQVLACLLDNAVRFTLRGRIDLEAAATPRKAGGWMLKVSVRDTGIGFSEGDRIRMFDPLAADSTAPRRDGIRSGMSLAMARHTVEALGGHLEGFGSPGKGSVFWFELPVDPPRSQAGAAADPGPDGVSNPASRASLRVLLTEPDTVTGQFLRRLLESQGHRAVTLVADEATTRVESPRWDAVVVRLPRPDQDSVAQLARIREQWAPRGIALLVVSPSREPGDEARWKDAGAGACLFEPIRAEDLRRALAHAFAGSDGDASPLPGSGPTV